MDATHIRDDQRRISGREELLDGRQRGAASFFQCHDGFFRQVEVGFLDRIGHGTI